MDKVIDYLKPPIIQISAKMTVFEACKRMKKYEVGAILVTEGKNYVGIFTEADLLKKVVAKNDFPGSTIVSDVMTKDIFYIDSEASMVTAFLKLQTKNIRHLVVKDKKIVAGVLSIKDVAKYYVHKFSNS
ncbi:MAG: CBS domain-containing protein [Nitrospina sp.]|jgi:CBS domain-containing protein|nr:CBS domain-containing protein [Nitrospina sp.]MBT6717729.1 CBS domain-containing protein [Nitrospina sp.]